VDPRILALDHADRLHLEAAQGWLGLGNWKEANEELEQIKAGMRSHPDVLTTRYGIYAQAGNWESAAEVAGAISQQWPDNPFGFIHRAYALHELKRTQEAVSLLLPVLDKFPKEWLMRYNLACYFCQLGDRKAAWAWLEKSIEMVGSERVKQLALDDPDLEPFWKDIAKL
jgi:predicted Zn-dependent protease